jgi:hypothetical protein
VSSAYTAYAQLLERIHDIENSRYLRLNRSIEVIKASLISRTGTYSDSSPSRQVRSSSWRSWAWIKEFELD